MTRDRVEGAAAGEGAGAAAALLAREVLREAAGDSFAMTWLETRIKKHREDE